MVPWIFAAILILIILTVLLAILMDKRRKGKQPPTDYYTLYLMGIIWLIIGVPLKMWFLSLFGLVLALIGIKNRDKWKENHKQAYAQKKQYLWLLYAGMALLVAVLVVLFFIRL